MKGSPRSLTHCLAFFNYLYAGVTVACHRSLFLVGWIATVCRLVDPPILAHSGSIVLSIGAPNLCFFSGLAASPFVGIAFVVGTVTSLRRWFALHCAVFFGRLFVAISLAERASSPFVKRRACSIPRPFPSRS